MPTYDLGPCDCCGDIPPPPPTVQTDCCVNPVPGVLHVSLDNISGCDCLDGIEFDITYNEAGADGPGWYGSGVIPCGGDPVNVIQIVFVCQGMDPSGWLIISPYPFCAGGAGSGTATPISIQCDPFEWVGLGAEGVGDCCPTGGTYLITITE